MSTPIVFIQQGAPLALSHLHCALLQARWWNPQTDIYVIGDAACRAALVLAGELKVGVVPIEDFAASGELLRAHYRHYSGNGFEYERFCLERWFVLRDFLTQCNHGSVWHMDSDVMIYADLNQMEPRLDGVDLTISHCSGHSSYLTTAAVGTLCDYILESYQTEPQTARLRSIYEAYQAEGSAEGVSDMLFVREVGDARSLRMEDLSVRCGSDPVFDTRINAGHGYVMAGGLKQLSFIDHQPHGTREGTGERDRFATLHFQHRAKAHMPSLLRAPAGALEAWSLPVIASLLTKFMEPAPTTAPAPVPVPVPARPVETPRKPNTKRIVKHLEAIRASRYLDIGGKLRLTQATRQLDETLALIRQL